MNLVRRSLLSRTLEQSESERQILNDHALSSIALSLTESAFLMMVVSAIEDPDEPDDELISDLRELADKFETQKKYVQNRSRGAEQIVEEAEVPPRIELTLVSPPQVELATDEVVNQMVRIKNVGDSTLTGIELHVEADNSVLVDSEATAIDDLSAGEELIEQTQIVGREGGDSVVKFDAVSENGGTGSISVDVSVTTGTILTDYTNQDGIVGLDGLRRAIDDWRDGRIEPDVLEDVTEAWRVGDE